MWLGRYSHTEESLHQQSVVAVVLVEVREREIDRERVQRCVSKYLCSW